MARQPYVKRVKQDLPKRIAAVRGTRSQRRFALDLGVFQQNVNRYELGKTIPNVDFLITVALKEGISIDWLLLGKGRMRQHLRDIAADHRSQDGKLKRPP